MRELLRQITIGLQANLYYLSLFAALAIPDICGALGSPDGTSSKAKCIRWFDEHVSPKYAFSGRQFVTGEDCYFFRCSLLHQGSSQHPKSNFSRIIFVEPAASGTRVLHCNIMNDVLNIDVRIFCADIVTGVEQWLSEVEHTERFQMNQSAFMTRYPDGLPPYIIGLPVIG